MNPIRWLRRRRVAAGPPGLLALVATALATQVPAAAVNPPPASVLTSAPNVPAPSAPLPAGTPLYAVEMVIFRSTTPAPAEDWSIAPSARGFGSAGTPPGAPPTVVRILGASDYRLTGAVEGLRRSGAWRPIAHAAWIQNAPNWGSHVGLPLEAVGVTVPGLTGSVFLERAPLYLHLGFNVKLEDGQSFSIDEMHNIRQNEKEYFDHPAFGIIAVVNLVKGATR